MEFPPSEFERTQLEKIQNGTLRPQPVFGRGFCYGIFTCDCVPRAEPDEFKRLIIEPTDASPEDLAQWRVEHKNTVTNRWLDVQCKFYNLWRLGGTKDDCIMYLRKKFSEAGFKLDPESIGRFGQNDERLQAMVAFWDKQCRIYDDVLKSHPKRSEFDRLDTLEDKIALDPDLFMDMYFLDRKTTPAALPFSKFDWNKIQPAVSKVSTLRAKIVGSGKNKVLRIGWNMQEVSSASTKDAAVKKEVEKVMARLSRLRPHHDFKEKGKEKPSNDRNRSPVGSYHMEFNGIGWKDDVYKPGRMWMDVRESPMTENIYEACFDFGPALRGVMLIPANYEALQEHSRIVDTVNAAIPEGHDDYRQVFLEALLSANNERRLESGQEAKSSAHQESSGPRDPTPAEPL